ncbi:MAG: SMC-Scp complex subunit ScpB [Planctomycetia bacterium]|nr:SMC-Scp complex subunit ScpB [Planctomycetia bacterium]
MARLEAVLFVAGEPFNGRKLAQFAGLADGTSARTLIRQLNQFYDRQGAAFRVADVAGGFQLLTRPKFSKWLRRLFPTPVEMRLSGPAMETLAVVAYRQPVLRAEIEAIRGVQCGEMLRQLLERDLVRISGRAEELGRPFVYATTRRFLQLFGLRHLDDLPRAEFLRTPSTSPRTAAGETTERNHESKPHVDANEESEVTIADIEQWESADGGADAAPRLLDRDWLADAMDARTSEPRAEDDDDDLEDEDDDDLDDDDDDDDDDDVDDEEEEDEWEEVDDEDDEEDDDEEDDEDDDDWEDDDEDDDDWDDDEDDDEEVEEEAGDAE